MTKEQERYIVAYLLDVVDNLQCPMLMYEHEKSVVRKALLMYLESIAEEKQNDRTGKATGIPA